MDSATSPPPDQTTTTHPLGVGEPLPVVDLPEPEEVFGVPHLGRKEVVKFVLGPSLIAPGSDRQRRVAARTPQRRHPRVRRRRLDHHRLGPAPGLLQPRVLAVRARHRRGAHRRLRPDTAGCLAVDPVLADRAVLRLHLERLGQGGRPGLYALLYGQVPTAADTTTVTLLAILLLLVVMGITMVSRKITRGLELANLTAISIQLVFLLAIDLFVVPFSVWWTGCAGQPPRPCRPKAATPPCSAAWPGSRPWRPGSTGT